MHKATSSTLDADKDGHATPPTRMLSMWRQGPCLAHGDARAAFFESLLATLSGSGDFHVELHVPRYPRDAQHEDLVRIGQDMYRAVGRYGHETPET